MALQYLFDPNKQFQSIGGVNEVGGFLRVFLDGTDDRATTYRNFDGGLNEPDIVLDTYGRAVVIVDDTKTYRIEVYNRLGGLMWTVSNYKARGGSGGGSGGGTGTPVSVDGTVGEIDVDENTEGGVKHFVIGLASTIKNAIATLTMAVNGVANALNGKKDKQTPVNVSGATTKTLVGISQDSDGVMTPEFDDIAFPDWTSAINAAVATCEKLENKKTTITGYESSNTYYPTIKAVVDFVNGMLQNLGGKLITDNGDPFTDSSDLPSTTPYGGVDIADKDYAYVQGVGTSDRWSATVSGSSVAWVQEYAISIPVFTPSQQAAIDSGATSTKINNYELHINNTAIHVTSSEKNAWNAKQNAIGDLAEIRSGAAAGATALQPNGNGSNVTSTFTAASSRTNISSGEKLSVIFGKIAKWFSDLKAVAFSGSYNDLSGTPTLGSLASKNNVTNSDISGTILDAHIASASTWNGKQNALPNTGTASDTYAINVSGAAGSVSTKIGSGEIKLIGVANNVAGNYKPNMLPNIRAYYDNNNNGNLLLVGPERGTSGASDKGGIRLSGGTGYYTQLQTADFTADRWHKLPDESGNLAVTTGTYPYMTVGSAKNATNHINNGNVHVTPVDKAKWNKAVQRIIGETKFILGNIATGIPVEFGVQGDNPSVKFAIGTNIDRDVIQLTITLTNGANNWMQGGQYEAVSTTSSVVQTTTTNYTRAARDVFGSPASYIIASCPIPVSSTFTSNGMYKANIAFYDSTGTSRINFLDIEICFYKSPSKFTCFGTASVINALDG